MTWGAWGAHQVDGNTQRAQLVGQATVLSVAWLTDQWIVVGALAVVMGVGAVCWPRGALFVRIHERFAVPRLSAVAPADGRPPRFSALLAVVTLAPVAGAIAVGWSTIGWAIVLTNVGAMVSEVIVGKCAPCELFVWLARRNHIRLRFPLVRT